MGQESRLHTYPIRQNRVEASELEKLAQVLGLEDKSDAVRLAVRFMLANQTFDQSTGLEITAENNINLVYNGMVKRLRLELFSITEKLLKKRLTSKDRTKCKEKLKLLKGLIAIVSESRKEEFLLNDIMSATDVAKFQLKAKELDIKRDHNKTQAEYLEHQKRLAILDRK